MDNNFTQLEILLMTGTSFVSENLCSKDQPGSDDNNPLSENQQLLEACWNGLVQTLLPEICLPSADGGPLYLFQVRAASSFLELELGDTPTFLDYQFSLTPHLFLASQSFN